MMIQRQRVEEYLVRWYFVFHPLKSPEPQHERHRKLIKGEHNGKDIAVKKLHAHLGLDDKDFDNEFRNLSKVRHENIVELIGYCYESRKNYITHNGELTMATIKERILCFDYMHGGSLSSHITAKYCDLDWPKCYKIITGTCEGLNHLHGAYDEPIFHMDLKPDNILLDENMTAKIADLGLSRLVNSTNTHRTMVASYRGTFGYMPPEYIDEFAISKKFDVYSLGAVIIRIMDGGNGHSRLYEMGAKKFIENVTENWERRLAAMSTSIYSSHKEDMLRVKTCVEIALRCVEKERNKRPRIKDIVQELEELEVEIEKMLLHSKDLTSQAQTISRSSVLLSFDPSLELRFLFEPRKIISSCLQLTNITDGFIVFSIITDKRKYCAQPNTGVVPPCSKLYISVTLQAQEETPPNMQCNDMFVVKCAHVKQDHSSDKIAEVLEEGKVDTMKLPIVYVATDQFPSASF
ncbi:unnamed protein product [Alopecurus aequalis]